MLRNCLLGILLFVFASQAFTQSVRERKLLDFGWRFHFGNASDMSHDFDYGIGWGLAKAGDAEGPADPRFDDSGWRLLNLPHDWAVELPFVHNSDDLYTTHGSKPISRLYPDTCIGWYRRTFEVPDSDSGKRISVEFDGVFRNSTIWLNGNVVGFEPSGYSSFAFDVTDLVRYGGKNVLTVRVDASQFEGWFYEGAGIYRHVWLVKTAPVHVAHWGTYITSEIGRGEATLKIQTEVANDSPNTVNASLLSQVEDPQGRQAGQTSSTAKIAAWATETVTQTLRVGDPQLWSTESPNLYKLVSTVSGGGGADAYDTTFGIRSISFDPNKGFFLNGKRVEIKGMCNHQDHAGVGAALPDRLQYFRIEKLKEIGCNAYRTSHNPPTPELLDACDRLGMLVMDENRLIGSTPWITNQLEGQIERDRNHPSVILWSIGNEESEENDPIGHRIGETMVALAHKLDPTRPTTIAANNGNNYSGVNSTVDVRGWNYIVIGDPDKYHADHPNQPMFGSEEASTLSTRGIYANEPGQGYMGAYDNNAPSWGSTAEKWWTYYAARPWLAGAFVWTGFDYRGEPTPYSWPVISSHFGVLDTCGFLKDNAYYYQAWWSNKDVLHLLPHWNWPGKEGQNISVWCYSNLDEVELVLNGKSLGKKAMPRNSHLEWSIAYQPGTLEARGYRGGKLVRTEKIETTGGPAAIVLTPDRSTINADSEDVSVIKVSAVDNKGREVPVASNDVTFQVSGGQIIGVGNGDPASHDNDRFIPSDNTYQTNDWRILREIPSDLTPMFSDDFDVSDWRGVNVNGDADQLAAGDGAVFHGFVDLPGIEAHSTVTLHFDRLGDHADVYVNGSRAGGTPDGLKSYSYDVNALVHPGRNYLLVVVKNASKQGGIGGGVRLRIIGPQPAWHRPLFNGLAELIVQSSGTPGTIKVTATSPGLKQADVSIEAKVAISRGL